MTSVVSGQQQQHHSHLTASRQPSEAEARSYMQQTQGASATLHTSLSAAQSGPGFIPTIHPADTTASTTDLADGLQMASLATPTTISPLYINDQAAAAAAVTALSSSHGQPMQPSTASNYIQGPSGTTSLAQQAAPSMAPTHPTSISGVTTPSLGPDSLMMVHQIDMAAAAAFVAQINAQSLQQQQQHMVMPSEQTSISMMQPMTSSVSASGALAPSLPSQMGALNLPAGSPTNNGLGIMSTLPLAAPLAAPGLQPAMVTQQQAAYAASMGGDPMYAAGAQFGVPISQPADQQYLGMAAATHMMAMPHAHSRTASTVDGGVAMYSNDDSKSATPRSGIAAGVSNMGAQLEQQLQQHQLQQSHGPLLKGLSANASTVASANQSGSPSPFSTTPMPMANQGNSAAPIGHRRQQSSSFLATMQHQHQQQQAIFVDPSPMAFATAPPTLVPSTPTPFGQVQFHLHAPGTATAPHPLSHPHASHFGHSRHLSLDAANFRLMAVDTPSMGGFPTHAAIHEHPVDMAQHSMQFNPAQQQQQQFQQQQQQLQQQLHHLQQLQAQQKSGSMMMHTVPATPLPHQPDNPTSFNSAPQLTPLGDPMAQHQFQQLQFQQQQRQQLFMHHHHSSASVDLGSLSSAFHHPAQYGQALAGQISPMVTQPNMPAGGPMAPMYMPIQFTQLAPQVARSQVTSNAGSNSAMAASPEESDDDDDDVDDEDISGEEVDVDEHKLAHVKSSKGTATSTSTGSGVARPAKVPAPYKRFRNSFIFFAKECRKQWRLENPNRSKIQNRGFIQEMSKTWNAMSCEERAPYIKMADDDKLRYESDVTKYGPLPSSGSAASLTGLAQDPTTGSALLSDLAAMPSTTASKSKAEKAENTVVPVSTARDVSMPVYVPIAPAPAPEPTSEPVAAPAPTSAPIPALGMMTASEYYQAATTADVSASAIPATASMAISIPTSVALPTISISSAVMASEYAMDAISPIYPSALHGNLTVDTMSATQGFPDTMAMPITPVAGSVIATTCEPLEFGPGILSMAAYQAFLQQALGPDFSPLTIEFDPSCFVNSDPASSDEATCLNPQALTVVPTESLMMTVAVEATSRKQEAAFVEGSGAKTPSNGPPIITQVGTKRKSTSDGQPLTNLPSSIKRFRNSFIYYVNSMRREIQGPDDGVSAKVEVNNREFLKEMSAKWRTMSEEEKAPFNEMANADKERFLRQMREYERDHPDEFNRASKHRRRRSSTSASNASISAMNICAADSTTKLSDLQHGAPSAEGGGGALGSSSGGLNISMTGSTSSLGGYGALAEAAPMPQDAHWAVSTVTPLSTTLCTPLTTPLLAPNVGGDKPEMQIMATRFSSLPSVPEELAMCSESSGLFMVNSTASAAAGTVAPSLLSTVAEEPEDSGRG
ncbi:hypothetical protein GGI24_000086 [Coemansia furcata]|nr:hypothetical protein GGI24_000086 [Coemansia furcata]